MNNMPLTSEPTTLSPTWRNKLFDFYVWCKVLSITLNIMYMVSFLNSKSKFCNFLCCLIF